MIRVGGGGAIGVVFFLFFFRRGREVARCGGFGGLSFDSGFFLVGVRGGGFGGLFFRGGGFGVFFVLWVLGAKCQR